MTILSTNISIRVIGKTREFCSRKCRFFTTSNSRICKLYVLLLTPAVYEKVGLVDVRWEPNCKFKRLPVCKKEFGV